MQHEVCELVWSDLVTLGYNANLASATRVPWSLMGFGMNNVKTIDCSIYVQVNLLTLEILGGMNNIRHLKFPKDFNGTLMTPFMALQGAVM
eukprot:729670-Ditylum_brightwellii.AAC.1